MPIYIIKPRDGDNEPARLIRADNQAQALRHLYAGFTAEAASAEAVVQHLEHGAKVETAGA